MGSLKILHFQSVIKCKNNLAEIKPKKGLEISKLLSLEKKMENIQILSPKSENGNEKFGIEKCHCNGCQLKLLRI